MSANLKYRPVVAWDIDGVVRVRDFGYEEVELIKREITFRQDDYPSEWHGAPRWDANGESTGDDFFSKPAVDLIKFIEDEKLAEQTLATTWQEWANTYFSEPLRLPVMSVAVKTLPEDSSFYAHCSPDWKAYQLSRQFDGRPLIWIDDNPTDRPGEHLITRRRPSDRYMTAVYTTQGYLGVTNEDAEEILEWINKARTPEGHADLRHEHRLHLKYEKELRAKARRKRAHESELYESTLRIAERMWPGQDYHNRELARLSRLKDGLTDESISYCAQRYSLVYDHAEAGKKLRRRGFHMKERRD